MPLLFSAISELCRSRNGSLTFVMNSILTSVVNTPTLIDWRLLQNDYQARVAAASQAAQAMFRDAFRSLQILEHSYFPMKRFNVNKTNFGMVYSVVDEPEIAVLPRAVELQLRKSGFYSLPSSCGKVWDQSCDPVINALIGFQFTYSFIYEQVDQSFAHSYKKSITRGLTSAQFSHRSERTQRSHRERRVSGISCSTARTPIRTTSTCSSSTRRSTRRTSRRSATSSSATSRIRARTSNANADRRTTCYRACSVCSAARRRRIRSSSACATRLLARATNARSERRRRRHRVRRLQRRRRRRNRKSPTLLLRLRRAKNLTVLVRENCIKSNHRIFSTLEFSFISSRLRLLLSSASSVMLSTSHCATAR